MKLSQKDLLREEVKAKRLALPVTQVLDWSRYIIDHCLEAIDWESVRSLHTFVPIAKWREVDTWPLLREVWSKWPHVLTAVPLGNKKNSAAIGPITQWQTNKQGFPEPRGETPLPIDYQFDVILVPLLAFDRKGHRIGFGGGYYDRFLATQKRALTIGLSPQMGLVTDEVPHEEHDIPLNYVITESGIITATV